jgi:ADYC domain
MLVQDAALAQAAMDLDVQGTEFILSLPDGSQRRSRELAGAVLEMPGGAQMRIDSVKKESLADGSELWLHALSVRRNDEWMPLCPPDSKGQALALPFPGSFTEDGHYLSAPGKFSISCTLGAQAKCMRFGYAPWKRRPDGQDLAHHYSACIRMVRADYCGDMEAHTVDGTLIDIYDDIGIQATDASLTDMRFEAGWTPDGAACVSHARIPSLPDPRQPGACPRLAAAPAGADCSEDWARSHGALLFSRSR